MRRSTGVTLSAVVSFTGSAIALLFAAATGVAPFVQPAGAEGATLLRLLMFAMSLILAAMAVWGASSAVGLLRLRPWARWSTLVFSGLLVFFFGSGAAMVAIMPMPPPPESAESFMVAVRIGISAIYAALALLGGFWLWFFNRASVKTQFQGGAAIGRASRRPVSVTVIAIFLLLGAAFLTAGVFVPFPVLIPGYLLTGPAARATCVLFAAAQVWIASGLLRLKPFSRVLALALFGYGILNSIATAAVRGLLERALAATTAMLPALPASGGYDAAAGLRFALLVGGLLNAVLALLLFRERQAFTPAAPGSGPETPAPEA